MKYSVNDIIEIIKQEDLMIDVDLSMINPDIPLTQQGVDSLDFASILFGIENKFGIKINSASVAAGEWNTINKILNKLEENKG